MIFKLQKLIQKSLRKIFKVCFSAFSGFPSDEDFEVDELEDFCFSKIWKITHVYKTIKLNYSPFYTSNV